MNTGAALAKSREYLTINTHKGFISEQGYNLVSIPLLIFFREKWKKAFFTYHDLLFELMTYLLQGKTIRLIKELTYNL